MRYAAPERGLSFKVTLGRILTLTPPLTVAQEELDQAVVILEEAFAAAGSSRG